MRRILFALGLFLCGTVAHAACSGTTPNFTAASASNSDITDCITAATANTPAVITVPASSGVSFSSQVTIPTNKCVTINGGGAVTVTSQAGFVIDMGTSCESRVTGFTFTGGSQGSPYTSTNIVINGNTQPGRLDHNTFTATGAQIFVVVLTSITSGGASYPFLIDHNTFNCGYQSGSACEAIHNEGQNCTPCTGGWTNNVTPGGPNMVFIEDNTFNQTGGNGGNQISGVEQFYGSQTVIRHNTLNYSAQLDAHGTAGFTGARWWEIYNNQFNQNSYSVPDAIQLRGGTGVVYSNTSDGTSTNSTPCGSSTPCFIDIFNENGSSGTWPNEWQVGSGINGYTNSHNSCASGTLNSAPAYLWNNTNLPIGTGGGVSGTIVAGRDYISSGSAPSVLTIQEQSGDTCSTTYTYTAYTYPHPLQSGDNPVLTPTFSPVAGTYTGTQNIVISTLTAGAALCWTTDGSTPTANGAGGCTHGTTYTTPVVVASSLTLKAVGTESGFLDSSVGSAAYTISASSTVTFSASSIAFGTVAQGSSSSPTAVTLTNLSGSTITYTGLTITGTNAVDFTQANTCNTFSGSGTMLTGAGNACSISVIFTPSTAGSESATLNLGFTGGGSSPQTVSLTGTGGAGSTFIPANRTIDWSKAGIPGGIPSANWPICQTISPKGGGLDDSTTIQSALNTCAQGTVVLLTAGTFTLHRTGAGATICPGKSDDGGGGVYEAGLCVTDKSIVLRGAGPQSTLINYGDGANIISIGKTFLSHSLITFTPITSAAIKGATTITVSSVPTGVAASTFIVISQTNPNDIDGNPLVQIGGYGSTCSYCGHDLPNNAMDQIDEVTNVTGNVITLARPLYWSYNNQPVMYLIPMIQSAGVENLRVYGTVASGTALQYKNINMEACAFCWVHNVESDWAVDLSNFYGSDVYGGEFSNNYAFQAYNHNAGADYSMFLQFRASEMLIANNIIRLARHSTPVQGTAGNVYIYNYFLNGYQGENHNFLPETQLHAPEAYMNLWEGNVMPNSEYGDNAHGSNNDNTFYHNYVNLTSLDPDNGLPMTGGIIAMNTAYYSNYENIVGNVFGQYPSGCTATTYETDASTAKVNDVIWQLGYFDDGGGSTPNQSLSNKVGATLLRGGNWDCNTGTTVWSSNIPVGSPSQNSYLPSQTLPSSLVFLTAPSYFAATGATWPPIDGTATTKVNSLPAQICYNAGGGPNTSLGGNFNPVACYSAVGTLGFSPTSLAFGNVPLNQLSAPQTVTLTNNLASTVTFVSLTFSNPDFVASPTTCNSFSGGTLGASSSCNITVSVQPTGVPGTLESATMTLSFTGGGTSPQVVTLNTTATGVAAVASAHINTGGVRIR